MTMLLCSALPRADIIERICKSSPTDGTDDDEAAARFKSEDPSVSLEKHLERVRKRRRREAPRLCPVCLVDLRHYKAASHCHSCNSCVVDADEHYDFVA
jgi:hypothetical protein